MKKFEAFLLCLVLNGLNLLAQNPIIRDQFTADPSARVFSNKIYLYPSHDIPAPDDHARKDWFLLTLSTSSTDGRLLLLPKIHGFNTMLLISKKRKA